MYLFCKKFINIMESVDRTGGAWRYATCHFPTFPLPSTYQLPIKSYRGRSWLGVGKALVGGYQLVGGYGVDC